MITTTLFAQLNLFTCATQKNASPNTNQYSLASVLCKSTNKPSTRFPLRRHVELKTSPCFFHFLFDWWEIINVWPFFPEIWSAPKSFISQRSRVDIYTHFIFKYIFSFWTIHFQCSQQHCLCISTFWHAVPQKSAGPNTNQYPLASVSCKSSNKPSTRFPLGRHVELKNSSSIFCFFVRQTKKSLIVASFFEI